MAAETKARALHEGTVTGLAADAKNEMELEYPNTSASDKFL